MFNLILISAVFLGVTGFIIALMLSGASKKFAVIENPLISEIDELLPHANCGACGFPGCRGFAEALITNPSMTCPVSDDEAKQKIAALLGVELGDEEKQVARLICQGKEGTAVLRGEYDGPQDCHAAMVVYSGTRLCAFGCIGLGSCINVCHFDAIHKKDGIIVIDESLCVGCGACIEECPKNVIKMVPVGKRVSVLCSSGDKGAVSRKACSAACIGCKKCVKVCRYDAVEVNSFLAKINFERCTRCGECADACPTGAIVIENPLMDFIGIKPDPEKHAVQEQEVPNV